MLFRDIIVYMTGHTLTEMFHSDLQQISIFTVFHAVNFLRVSQLPVLVPELGINSAKPCSIFKSPLVLSMIVTNGGNKLFPTCKSNIVKITGHNFTGVHPSQAPIMAGERKCIILSFLYIKPKDEVFLRFSNINCCSKRVACN